MRDIDEMDMLGFLHVRAYNMRRKKTTSGDTNEETERPAPGGRLSIDEAFPGLI